MAKLNDKLMNRLIQGKLKIEPSDDVESLKETLGLVDKVNFWEFDEGYDVLSSWSSEIKEGDIIYDTNNLYVMIVLAVSFNENTLNNAHLFGFYHEGQETSIVSIDYDTVNGFQEVNGHFDLSVLRATNSDDFNKSLATDSDGNIVTKLQPTLHIIDDDFDSLPSNFVASLKQGDVIYNSGSDYTAFVTYSDNVQKELTVFGNSTDIIYVYSNNDDEWLFDETLRRNDGTKLYKHHIVCEDTNSESCVLDLIFNSETPITQLSDLNSFAGTILVGDGSYLNNGDFNVMDLINSSAFLGYDGINDTFKMIDPSSTLFPSTFVSDTVTPL